MTKLPTKIYYYDLTRGILGYEDNSPLGYVGECEIIRVPFSMRYVDAGKIDSVQNLLLSIRDKKMWLEVLPELEKTVILGIKNVTADVELITWGIDSKTNKDIMRLRCKDSKTYTLVAELAYQYLETRRIIKNNG